MFGLVCPFLERENRQGRVGDYRFGDTRHTVSSGAALKQLGWQPQTSLDQTIGEYIEWVKEQPNLKDFYGEIEGKMRAANIIRRSNS